VTFKSGDIIQDPNDGLIRMVVFLDDGTGCMIRPTMESAPNLNLSKVKIKNLKRAYASYKTIGNIHDMLRNVQDEERTKRGIL